MILNLKILSQGTLIALAALSKHQLLDIWKSAALLSPISYLSHITSKLARAAAESMIADVNTIAFYLR